MYIHEYRELMVCPIDALALNYEKNITVCEKEMSQAFTEWYSGQTFTLGLFNLLIAIVNIEIIIKIVHCTFVC